MVREGRGRWKWRVRKKRTIVSLTITGFPVEVKDQCLLADAVITVDFALIAADRITSAAFSKRKRATALSGAIIVQATNLRPRKAAESAA